MNSDIEISIDPDRIRPKKSEVFRLWCDNKKLIDLTNFLPKYSIEDGLKLTIEWFKDPINLAKYKSDIYNI